MGYNQAKEGAGMMGKLDKVNAELKRLEAMQAEFATRLEEVQQKKAALEEDKKTILAQHEAILHRQSRKERTRKLIRIGALVAKQYKIDLAQDIDLAAIEKMINEKDG
jgi:hypothetical protein